MHISEFVITKTEVFESFRRFWWNMNEYWPSSYPTVLEDKYWEKIFQKWLENGQPQVDFENRFDYLEYCGYWADREEMWEELEKDKLP